MSEMEQATDAAAKAVHDAIRDGKFLRWETSSDEYRAGLRELVRPAVESSFAAGRLAGLREAAALCPTVIKAGKKLNDDRVTERVVIGGYGFVPSRELRRLAKLLALAEWEEPG